MADEISFPSTGNDADDEEFVRKFRLHSERMAENICPNGCGQMIWDDPHNRHCPICDFGGFSTKPYDMKTGNA